MKDLKSFLQGNAEIVENRLIEVSERFKDEQGNPIPWEVRALPAEEEEQIRKSCFVSIKGQNHGQTEKFDPNRYMIQLAAACTVYPDLENAELQDSYGVHTAPALLKKMLYAGELNRYFEAIESHNRFKSIEEKIDEVKN